MIVVLADDLSGAAELAGVALQHGLAAEVQTAFHPATVAGVVCLDSNTRLLSAAQAARRVAALAGEIAAARPDWVFKKCDSVLRGPVLAEARAMAQVMGKDRMLILSANPSRQRVIRDGQYLIEGKPLHVTAFARDPVHPRTTPHVTELLDGDLSGVQTPDAGTAADVARVATGVDAATLPVGAADFFAALLAARIPARPSRESAGSRRPSCALLVCGSAASWAQRRQQAESLGHVVFELTHDPAAVARVLASGRSVLLGIGDGKAVSGQTPATLLAQLALTVTAVRCVTEIPELLLEGGATAAAVLAAVGWTRLRAVAVADGVAELVPAGHGAPHLFIKPGSYAWPATLWPPR